MSITTSTSFGLTHRVSAYPLSTEGTYTPPTEDPYTPPTEDPFRRVINGVLCERVSIDGVWATIDGQPVYMEI